ncbi:MAG: F0F1 ATP synthase subunit epsilon [Desulfobacterota bacterium]|nr:F0F1 ATP synthase subunit epsilon [Thermodesulfobacteriota bacterium]
MDDQPFILDVVTLKRVVFSEPVESVVAPGTVGYFGILPGHTPFVSSLQVGITRITKPGGEKLNLFTSTGFLMTDGKRVILLADAAERPEEIDTARAQRAKERAEKRLAERAPDTDINRAKVALLRAVTRLKLAQG